MREEKGMKVLPKFKKKTLPASNRGKPLVVKTLIQSVSAVVFVLPEVIFSLRPLHKAMRRRVVKSDKDSLPEALMKGLLILVVAVVVPPLVPR